MLLAQAGNRFDDGGGEEDPALLAVMLIVVFSILGFYFLILGLFLRSLSLMLAKCDPRNLAITPGRVWLNLIPCFNIFWRFITVQRVTESLENEFRDRRWRRDGDFGKNVGLWAGGTNLLGNVPYIGALFTLISLICFIVYWVKIVGYSKDLDERPHRGASDDHDDPRRLYDDDADIPIAQRAYDEPPRDRGDGPPSHNELPRFPG